MAGGASDECEEVEFEEGKSLLPSHVLHEAIRDPKEYVRHQQYQHYRSHPKFPPDRGQKSRQRVDCRNKYPTNWASGGPGMQAVFLDSGRKSCGTGVFLPQRAGTKWQASDKPACSPVLLPMRVVQALNLNVHELGLRISRGQDTKGNSKGIDDNSVKNKNGNKHRSTQCCMSSNQISSSEIFLPKEWTY